MLKSNFFEFLEHSVTGLGYELVHYEISDGGLIRVFIDKDGGIVIKDCETVSRHLSKLFAVEDVDYNQLEVSSPGLDRILRKPSDFQRFAGQTVKLRFKEVIEGFGARSIVAQLIGIEGDEVGVHFDNKEIRFRLDQLQKARLVPSLK